MMQMRSIGSGDAQDGGGLPKASDGGLSGGELGTRGADRENIATGLSRRTCVCDSTSG